MFVALTGGLLSVMVCAVPSVKAVERTTGIWKILRDGHFSGPMNDEAWVRTIPGSIVANGKRYRFMEHYWEEKRPSGHGATRVLVFEQTAKRLSYVGFYRIDLSDFKGTVHPQVRGRTLFFPFHSYEILDGKNTALFSISFENGPPLETSPGSIIKLEK